MDWLSNFDERELKEIKFCLLYKRQFSHGTMGHNVRIIVAKMASILENAESVINQTPERVPLDEAICD
jgi:hypothetical protein